MKQLNQKEISLVIGGNMIENNIRKINQGFQRLSAVEMSGVAALGIFGAIAVGNVLKLPVWVQMLIAVPATLIEGSIYLDRVKPVLQSKGWIS